jgi:peptidoglycan hydrolase CwlO-like protein
MVFKSDARLSEMQREIEHLDQALHGLEASFETNLKNFIASSWDNTRAIDALRAEIEVLHAQNASLREEIITRSRPADAN